MADRKWIVDTTLRDGEQSPGIAFREEDKIALAVLLDEMGVYEIEAGIPAMETEGKDYIEEIKKKCNTAKVSVWSRMKQEDIRQAVVCEPDILHIGAPVSYVQIYGKLKKNKTWVQKTLQECIDIALSSGVEVTVGFEDASRSDEGFLINTAKIVKELGGSAIRIADTVGVLTPQRTKEIVERIRNEVGIGVEFHAHNDLGMGVANSIAAAKAGADYIDCTLLGIGERSGNCDLYQFLFATERMYNLGIDKKKVREAENILRRICTIC